MAQLGNNLTFNRGKHDGVAVGYHSRTVFSYATTEPISTYDTTMTNDSETDGIQFLINNSSANDYHGTHIIPAYYWRPGKTFRVSGTLIATSQDTTGSLNMRFGLIPGNSGAINWLAIQNNNNNHQFAGIANYGPLPVDFSCDIFCSFINDNEAEAQFGAAGYYQYNYSNYNSAGNNRPQIYVPVWTSVFPSTLMEETYINQSTIMFNLFGSTIQNGAEITRLTIEELA
jgi:hypothetical protein